MDAIKKKMQAMKIEKENALDKSEQLEQKLRDVEEAKAKMEEDLSALQKKHTNLENEFDKVNEQFQEGVVKAEASEKRVTEGQLANQGGHTSDMGASSRVLSTVSVERVNHQMGGYTSVKTECLVQDSGCLHSPVLDLLNGNKTDGDMPKKKLVVKKVKKKRKKTKADSDNGKDGETSDITKRSDRKQKTDKSTARKVRRTKTKSSDISANPLTQRPDPEGGNCVIPQPMDEYDRIIYSKYPIFSDLELSDDNNDDHTSQNLRPNQRKRFQNGRKLPEGSIMLPCAMGINSGTMLRLSIIDAELKNIIKGSLRMVGKEMNPLMSCSLHAFSNNN